MHFYDSIAEMELIPNDELSYRMESPAVDALNSQKLGEIHVQVEKRLNARKSLCS
jgi:hypothetical protein